ncbi:hypothetical protein A3J77_01950 [Candidatus Wolfebacteria bacterium RBG_13_41_7]|uniref:GerMN domain-containing protein n=1 Tax=Candidatus Wolfebacteria bacterium RBG_13_41_7 TaxID=1802554 RepID=A0A1F8DLE4_9BACT|nr:MAG: hypothetical protein A3J77_01950 [Candidatus Wolfebacteria bacterium RBG_13_41_7]
MNKKLIFLTVISFIVLVEVATLIFLRGDEDIWLCQNGEWVKHGNPSSQAPIEGCAKIIGSFDECVAAGYPIMESYPSQCVTPSDEKFIEDIGNEFEKMDLIIIDNPRPNQIIESPIIIEGQARGNWFFEASFPIKLFDADGNQIAMAIAQANPPAGGDWMTTDFVPFKAILGFASPETSSGVLILEKDNPSGLPQSADQLRVPVKFEAFAKSIVVKAYFNNSKMDPEASCNKVFPVDRVIFKTSAVARAALEELLKGPTKQEKTKGFFTSINPDVKIEKLTIENGVAKVEFDEQLESQVGGSCRVAAIRWQIIETLKQFPTVKDVIISINGRTEDILQP